jgi:triosephosphate isomerase (TIM)
MRPCIVAANWKMHLDAASATALAQSVRHHVESLPGSTSARIILCVPFPFLERVREVLDGSTLGLGAQNMHTAASGAFTGEVSAPMLLSAGCDYVILGHSERRLYFHESDSFINEKVKAALKHGLTPIVCVGETLEQREQDITEQVIHTQVHGVLDGLTPDDMRKLIVAYEPVWAIGTGRTASPGQAQEVHALVRSLVSSMYGADASDALVIQYGGSVKADNAAELFSQPDVDGGLVGGASLDAAAFAAIIDAAVANNMD